MSDNNTYQEDIDINNPEFDNSNKSKIRAISKAAQALQIAQKLEWNDRTRDIERARVLAAFNGSAPYSDTALISRAQGYRYNVSFGFLEGVIGRAVVPYNELTINFKDLTAIEANLNDEKLKIVQSELAKIVEKWGKWPKFITRLNQDLVLNGYNTAIFPSYYDPFPVFIAQKDAFTDEGVMNDVNDLQVFIWRKSYMLHELYAQIQDPEIGKKAGWNVDNVKEALMSAMANNVWNKSSTTSGTWTATESLIRDGALWASIVGAKLVNVYHVFVTEIDGKVTHYTVLNQGTIDTTNNEYADQKIELFKKEDRFDAMRDMLVYFDIETGDGTWHGSRGVGRRAFNTHKAIDKLRCSLLDQAFVSGLTLLQPGDQVSQEDMTLSVFGPFAVIPQGITISTSTLPAISNTAFQVDSLLAATSEQRIGDIVPQSQSQTGGDKTATEAKIAAGRQELIARGNLKRYIDPVSQMTSIMVRRLLIANSPNPYAKEFQKELKKKGLTDDDLKEIRGARNTGKIDDVLGITAQNTQVMFAEFRGDPQIDQEMLKRKRLTSLSDADTANELLITDKDQTRQLEAQRFQELENTTIQSGLQVPVSVRDNHEAHLEVVLQYIGSEVQKQAQQFNEQVIPILKLATAHAANHLSFLQQDKTKKQVFDQFKERTKEAANAITQLSKQAMQLAKASFNQARKLAKTPEEQAQVAQAEQQMEQSQQEPQTV